MARLDAFYLSPEKWAEPFRLDGAEAAHCLRVLRKKPGDEVRLFDGAGREGRFRLVKADRNTAEFAPLALAEVPKPENGLVLAVGWTKSSRRGTFLEKAVELGALGVLFWRAERGQGQPPERPKDAWRERCLGAAKQCGAAWPPELTVVPDGAAGLAALAGDFERRLVLWEHPELRRGLRASDLAGPGRTLCVIGPEGGLTEAEAETFLQAGFTAASLGQAVLRWETAALLALCLDFLNRQGALS